MMKKSIISIVIMCVALLSASTVSAQKSRWGVMVGADMTDLEFDQNLFSVNQNVGGTLGVMGELILPGVGFGFDAGLLYTMRGAELNLGEKPVWASQGYGKENCMLHYIEIPIHLKLKYNRLNGFENVLMPMVFVGPEFSFLVAHSDLQAMKYPAGEFGLNVGFGVEIKRKVQVAASYCKGMSYALKTKELDDFIAKNKTWKVTCTYLF